MELAVCYYPEQISGDDVNGHIKKDLALMKKIGIRWVRVGEFMWSTYERRRDVFDWSLLDVVMDEAAALQLKIVLCTPTATPPKWLIDENPEGILAHDSQGIVRQFGSRRHYSFSSQAYLFDTKRIITLLCERYSDHAALGAWQTDNEYGCHDTTYCYAPFTLRAFRKWLERKYVTIDTLNADWGNAFWSQTYNHFDEIEFPVRTVAQPNPSHVLDFRHFSSEQVKAFNREQYTLIRAHSPKDNARPVIHNFMGAVTDFDHYNVSEDLDCVAWDNYPLGYLAERPLTFEGTNRGSPDQEFFFDKGDPDFSALHHDLYRSMGRKGWWVMELQPGPVNWARYNPIPYRDTEVPYRSAQRLWAWEAFAHGAAVVSFFRFRQNRQAQEQYHTALLYSDDTHTAAVSDITRLRDEIQHVHDASSMITAASASVARHKVAILYDYASTWAYQIHAQAEGFSFLKETYKWYSGLRTLGLDVDFIAPHKLTLPGSLDHLSDYAVVILPSNAIITAECAAQLRHFVKIAGGTLIVGARSGSLDEHHGIPTNLPPGVLQELMGVRVPMASALPNTMAYPVKFDEESFKSSGTEVLHSAAPLTMTTWIEDCTLLPEEDSATSAKILARFTNGQPALTMKNHHNPSDKETRPGTCYNFHGLPSSELVNHFLSGVFNQAKTEQSSQSAGLLSVREHSGLAETFFPLPRGIRVSFWRGLYFALNYSRENVTLPVTNEGRTAIKWIIGTEKLHSGDVSIWQNSQSTHSNT